MAVTGSFNIKNAIALSDGSNRQLIDWFRLNVEYIVDAVPGQPAYSIKLRCQLASDYDMNYWALDTVLKLSVDNSGYYESIGNPSMNIYSSPSGGIGDWTDWYSFIYTVGSSKSNIKIDVMLDLSSIVGSETGQPGGPDYVARPGYHFRDFVGAHYVNVSGIVIGRRPILSYLENNNKFNNPLAGLQNNVSADTNSIAVRLRAEDWGDPHSTAYWNCSNGASGTTNTDTFSVYDLAPGTRYTINVYLKNSIGQSQTRSIDVRTRYQIPTVSLSIVSVDLEKISLAWTSDTILSDTKYKIDGGNWIGLNQTGKNNTFTAKWFTPKTTHTIYFYGKASAEYDGLDSQIVSATGTTLDISRITSIGDCIFGGAIQINIAGKSTKPLQLEIWTEGNGSAPRFTFDVSNGIFTFKPNQSQLDSMYRCYEKLNQIPIYFTLTTKGEWKNWKDTLHTKALMLTGIAKTAHIGVNNSARRVQVWIGDSNNKPRRAVVWTGINNKPHRTI